MDVSDVELATLLAFEYAADGGLLTAARRSDFLLWTHLLAAAHPLPSCQAGARSLYAHFDAHWPQGHDAPAALHHFAPCGDRPRPAAWGACAGSVEGARGYSCGLWTLLHALAEGVDEQVGGSLWHGGAKAYVGSFFACDDCRAHFVERLSHGDVAALAEPKGSTRRLAALWAWRIHNEVNARLAGEEGAAPADPQHPKQSWPSDALCPSCACQTASHCEHFLPEGPGGGLWDEDHVSGFLTSFYGPQHGTEAAWDPFGLGEAVPSVETAAVLEARIRTVETAQQAHLHNEHLHERQRGIASGLHETVGHVLRGRQLVDPPLPRFSGAGAPGMKGGRAMDAHDSQQPLSAAHHALGGVPTPLFVLLCALAPVAAYAALQACCGARAASTGLVRRGSSGGLLSGAAVGERRVSQGAAAGSGGPKPGRYSPSWHISRLMGGKKKTGLGASLAALNGQSLKTV
jgi:hypothetical protein